MKPKILFSVVILALFTLLYVPETFSQPTWNLILVNDALTTTSITNDTYQVDVYIQSTDANPIECAAISLGFEVPLVSINGGTITVSFVPG